jgi:hypothetical protein
VKIFNEFPGELPHQPCFVRVTTHQPFSIPLKTFLFIICSSVLELYTATRSVAQESASVISPDRQSSIATHQQHLDTLSTPLPTIPKTLIAQNPPSIQQPGLPVPPILPSPVNPAVPRDLGLPNQIQPSPATTPSPTPTIPVPETVPSPLSEDPRYIVSPRDRDPKTVKPRTTQITIDGDTFTHRSQFELSVGAEVGDQRSSNLSWNASWLNGATFRESTTKDRRYRREYQSWYGRFSSFRQQREVVTNVVAPETALGFRQQISLVADCLPASAPLGADGKPQTCTYLPGRSTDRASIDPKKLIPTRFNETSKFQDLVSPASLAAMKEPGFQGGANGEDFSVDLYVPLAGTRAGNTQNNTSQVDRREFVTNSPAVTVGKMRQVILSNGSEVALARTIRGFTYVGGDPNFVLNSAVILATAALPDAEPSLPPGPGVQNKPAFSNSLFLAADNARLPESSFTAYSAGWGNSRPSSENNPLPTANYHGVWIGLSPIIHREIITDKSFESTSPERITSLQGNEGVLTDGINVSSNINGVEFNNIGLTNSYSQGYLTLYERDVTSFNSFIIREKTYYHPHLSFTGNVTTADSVLRYYTGGVFIAKIDDQPQTVQAYIGGDFRKTEDSGLSYGGGAIGYVNPSPDNYSQINANISQRIRLGSNSPNALTLSSSVLYALDGSTNINNTLFRSGSSYVNVGANLNIGSVALATTYYVPAGLPNEIESQLTTSVSWRVADNLILSGYYTPINNNISKSTMGASTSWRMGNDPNSPTLSLSWNRNEIDFARGNSTPINNYSDNVFGIYFRFGAPGNPFQAANP